MTIGLNIKGHTVIIDEDDYAMISRYSWRVHKNKYVMSFRYISPGKCKTIFMHRLIMGVLDAGRHVEIDHKNRNPLDNRKSNLRMATRHQNAANHSKKKLTKGCTSKYVGVYHATEKRCYPEKKYIRACITVGGKNISLGGFPSEEAAAVAYNQAALKYFGEFACLNHI